MVLEEIELSILMTKCFKTSASILATAGGNQSNNDNHFRLCYYHPVPLISACSQDDIASTTLLSLPVFL